jgi:cysteine desulfurase
MTEDYGNPSSMHRKGIQAEGYIKAAAGQIAASLKVSEQEIYFTSGGTESNNWALISGAMANRRRGNHIITTAIEHPAVSGPIAYLEEQGFTVTRIGTDSQGKILIEDLKAAITKETILISIMHVNNEIGSVQEIGAIGAMIHQKNPKVIFHVDAIQAYGKYLIRPKKMQIDLLSVSGHKIHGPKGVGFLYISDTVKMIPLLYGGGQQKGMRSEQIMFRPLQDLDWLCNCVIRPLMQIRSIYIN